MNILEHRLSRIATKGDLSLFVEALRDDFIKNQDAWENATLERYLEALARWIKDSDGYFENAKIAAENVLPWQLMAMMLLAARIYE